MSEIAVRVDEDTQTQYQLLMEDPLKLFLPEYIQFILVQSSPLSFRIYSAPSLSRSVWIHEHISQRLGPAVDEIPMGKPTALPHQGRGWWGISSKTLFLM